jgi:hypothetical protein
MRRSAHVHTVLLMTLAASLTGGCRAPEEVRNCVDAQNHIRPDQDCERSHGGGGGFHYVYGGSSGGREGDTVVGGREEPTPGARVTTDSEGVSRGGFGDGAHGSGGE